MGYIEDFGFEIYRLQLAQDSCEFLIYDIDSCTYYQFSKTRFYDMLKLKIEKIINKSLADYMQYDLELIPEKESNISKYVTGIFQNWVREEIIIIDNINYKPIDQKLFEEDEQIYFNIYQKAKILDETKEGEFENINKIIMNLVGNDKEAYNYFISWLAWQIKYPTKRLATSIIFQGEQGTGKTLLCNHVLRHIFGKNYAEINQSDLNKEYNDYIMGKQLIVANEVIYSNSKTASSDRLKNYVTDKYVSINRKYKDSMNIINYAHWIFTSNNQVPIKIERGDRRYTVFKSKKLGPVGFEIYQNLVGNLDEVTAFTHYLLNLDVKFDYVNAPFITEAKKDIIDATSNSVESFFESVEEAGGIDKLNEEYEQKDNMWKNYINIITNSNNSYVKIDSIYQLYIKFCQYNGFKGKFGRNQFTSMLKHLNKHITVVKDDEDKSIRVMRLGGKEE